jgi:hypothetical protein
MSQAAYDAMITAPLHKKIVELHTRNEQLRSAWLRRIQIENECAAHQEGRNPGKPCHSYKCGCALEMQSLIDSYQQTTREG